MKVPELKAEAKRLGLNNYSRLKKQELINVLRNQRTPPIEPITKKFPTLGSEARAPVRTKNIPAPTKKIEMSPEKN